jgi:UDP-N-acetylmuramyl pentapeptide phosphotransferase/UDP-N-acetylglucosamine-1-phosphate transferase
MILNLLISTFVLIVLLIYGHKLSQRGSDDLLAVQSAHHRDTVRFGGVAIIFGIYSIFFVKPWSDISIFILVSGLPLFLAGLLEDITGKVSPRNRLLAAFISAGLAVLITGAYLKAGDFWLLNNLFIFPMIAIPITMLISAGIANAFNIIDGVNGFSAGVALIISCVLGYICFIYDEPNLGYFCYMIALAIIPFLLLNFPFGYIFLGDAGAYTLGHLLSWVGIILLFRHPEISAWALFLMFFWPATETLLSIYRRFMSKKPSGAPDSFHFHQLIMQLIQLLFARTAKINRWANPLSTLILIPLAGIPIVASFFLIQNNKVAILVYLTLVVAYLFLYVFLVNKVKLIALLDGNDEIVDRLNHIFTPKIK